MVTPVHNPNRAWIQFDPKAPADLFSCPNTRGEGHAWSYRREIGEYFCPSCKLKVSKLDLKKQTDKID